MKTLYIVYFNYMQDLYGSSIGSTIKAERLFENLQQMGHTVSAYWRYADEELDPHVQPRRVQKNSIKPFLRKLFFTPKEILKNLVELFREWKFLHKHHPDVVIIRCDAYRYSAALLCKLLNMPLIVEADGANSYEWLTFNNKDGNIWRSWLLGIEKYNFKIAKHIFVQSNIAKDYYASVFPDQQDKISVITNGADLRSVDNVGMKQKLEIPIDAVVCGFVGSMHYWHNTGLLFGLLNTLMPKHTKLYFVMVGGGGPMADAFKQQCAGYDWSNRIIFTGKVPYETTHEYMNIMDITLAPYAKSDMFYYSPVKVFEYMAQGRAVVTTAVGQIEELVQDGVNGLFFDPDLENDLSDKVDQLLSEPELRKTLGDNARACIAREHTWKHKAEQLQQLCLDAVN